MHKLLEQQLKQYLGSADDVPEQWRPFLEAVAEAYERADVDRTLMERLLDLTSDELSESNQQRAVLERRVRALGCLNDIGRMVDEGLPIPELLERVSSRVAAALPHLEDCRVAVELGGQVYGHTSALRQAKRIVHELCPSGQPAGCVCLAHSAAGQVLDEDDTLVADVARRLSAAIETRSRLRDAKARAHHEHVLREIMAHVRGETDIDAILRTTARELGSALERRTFVCAADAEQVAQLVQQGADGVISVHRAGLVLPDGYVSDGVQVYATGELAAPAVRHDPGGVSEVLSLDVPAMVMALSVPGAAPLGILGFYDDGRVPLAGPERVLATSVAEQAALALENAHLFSRTQEALAQAEALHRRYLRQTWDAFLGGQRGRALGYVAEAGGTLTLLEGPDAVPAEPGPDLADVGRGEEPERLDGARGASLAVPLSSREGATIGTVELCRDDGEVGWSDDEKALVELLVEQIAESIVGEQLFDQTQASLAEARRLYEAGRRISEASDRDGVLQVVLDVVSATHADRAAVFMFGRPVVDGVPTEHELVGSWDRSGADAAIAVGREYAADEYPLLRLLSPQESLVVTDVDADGRLDGAIRRLLARLEARALAAIPLSSGAEWLGHVAVIARDPYVFAPEELRLYESVSSQAAVALRSLRLLREAENRARRERIIREITSKIGDTVELDSILNTTVEQLGRALGVSRAFVRLTTGSARDSAPGTAVSAGLGGDQQNAER